MVIGFKEFRKKYRDKLSKEFKTEIVNFKENIPKNVTKDSLDNYRTKVAAKIVQKDKLITLGKIHVIMHRNKAEIMHDTCYDSLYKHGYR